MYSEGLKLHTLSLLQWAEAEAWSALHALRASRSLTCVCTDERSAKDLSTINVQNLGALSSVAPFSLYRQEKTLVIVSLKVTLIFIYVIG